MSPASSLIVSKHHQCNYNWKTFIEVVLEDYHVAPFHVGLGGFVDCDQLDWQFGEWYSVQRVGITSLSRPGTAAYRRWHVAVQDVYQGEVPPQGAIFLFFCRRLFGGADQRAR